jgi:AhpD family alkylhydroperoxidase
MDYANLSKETVQYLYEGYNSLKNGSLPQDLRVLVELRVSQINRCNYCCHLHEKEAAQLGIHNKKINALTDFLTSIFFTNAEKEALSWAESLTILKTKVKVKETQLHLYFNEREIVDLTLCISLMNLFNRLSISMRDEKEH